MVEGAAKYGDLDHLPQFPAIATKLMRVLSNDDTSMQTIADLVRVDSALSVELLRVVNSPLFGFPTHIGSIQQTLILLGMEAVKRHVLAASMKMFFRCPLRLDLLRGIWRHSVACALVCEELSIACSTAQKPDDGVYTAGLLHDVGRLGLFVSRPRVYAHVLETSGAGLREREVQAFGFDHCEAGAWLASKWGLPPEIQYVAAGHHEPLNGEINGTEDIVRIGVLLTDNLGFDVLPPERPYTLQEIRTLLPHSAQYRFDPDERTFKARVTARLNTFD